MEAFGNPFSWVVTAGFPWIHGWNRSYNVMVETAVFWVATKNPKMSRKHFGSKFLKKDF